jgi:hypothetical protein
LRIRINPNRVTKMAENDQEQLVQGRLDLDPANSKEPGAPPKVVDDKAARIVQVAIAMQRTYDPDWGGAKSVPQDVVAVAPDVVAVELDIESLGDEYRKTAERAAQERDRRRQRLGTITSQNEARTQTKFVDQATNSAMGGKKGGWGRRHY